MKCAPPIEAPGTETKTSSVSVIGLALLVIVTVVFYDVVKSFAADHLQRDDGMLSQITSMFSRRGGNETTEAVPLVTDA